MLSALASGLGTCFQVVPFQCKIRGASLPARLEVEPTAQASPAETTATPATLLYARPGLGTLVHAVPFQCRIAVPGPPRPTVQAFPAEVAATPDRLQQVMADCVVLPERLGRAALAAPVAQAVARPDAVSANPAATAQNIRVTCLLMGCRPSLPGGGDRSSQDQVFGDEAGPLTRETRLIVVPRVFLNRA
jgi:hypothetical protein